MATLNNTWTDPSQVPVGPMERHGETPLRKLLGLIIDQGLAIDQYFRLEPLIKTRYLVTDRHAGHPAAGELVRAVIAWEENPAMIDSLESVLKSLFIVNPKPQ
jgi:hypothetical protein